MKIFRQGDVLIVKVSSIPKNLEKIENDGNRVVLAYGEVTGHAHAIYEPEKVDHYVVDEITQYLRSIADVKLLHEEHDPIHLDEGCYKIIQQREYDQLGQIRRVMD